MLQGFIRPGLRTYGRRRLDMMLKLRRIYLTPHQWFPYPWCPPRSLRFLSPRRLKASLYARSSMSTIPLVFVHGTFWMANRGSFSECWVCTVVLVEFPLSSYIRRWTRANNSVVLASLHCFQNGFLHVFHSNFISKWTVLYVFAVFRPVWKIIAAKTFELGLIFAVSLPLLDDFIVKVTEHRTEQLIHLYLAEELVLGVWTRRNGHVSTTFAIICRFVVRKCLLLDSIFALEVKILLILHLEKRINYKEFALNCFSKLYIYLS